MHLRQEVLISENSYKLWEVSEQLEFQLCCPCLPGTTLCLELCIAHGDIFWLTQILPIKMWISLGELLKSFKSHCF